MHFTLATSIVALAVLAAAAPQPVRQGGGVAIPITSRSPMRVHNNGTVDVDALQSHAASVKAKFLRGLHNFEKNTGRKHPSVTSSDVVKRGAGFPLEQRDLEIWYGEIQVGVPPRTFTVQIDTGSSDLFLASAFCDPSCDGHNRWDPRTSSTWHDSQQNFFIEFEDGSTVTGRLFFEYVSMGNYIATDQAFGAAGKYSSEFTNSPADGLMGLAFASISTYHASSFFETLVAQKQVSSSPAIPAAFSVRLSSEDTVSELYIGGANPRWYTGGFTYTPVTEIGFWQVKANLIVNGQTVLEDIDVMIDTGTFHIVGEAGVVSTLYRNLGATNAPGYEHNWYAFPCDSFPPMSLQFKNTAFPISYINTGPIRDDPSLCLSGLRGSETGSTLWIIGALFLSDVYTTFDYTNKQVGFAKVQV